MVSGIVAATCLILGSSAHHPDDGRSYYELLPAGGPVGGTPEYRRDYAKLEALARFVQKSIMLEVFGCVPRDKDSIKNCADDLFVVERETFAVLRNMGFPQGLIESYRVQSQVRDVVRRAALTMYEDDGEARCRLAQYFNAQDDYMTRAYEKAAREYQPDKR